MRRALVSILVLLAACETESTSFLPAARPNPDTDPCAFDKKCDGTPPKEVPPGLITIENDSEVEIDVGSSQASLTITDERLLTGSLDFEVPSSVLPASTIRLKIPPHEIRPIGMPISVFDPEVKTLTSNLGAILELGGVTALYVGSGVLRTRRVDAILQLVPVDATKVRIVRFTKEVPSCKASEKIAFDYAGTALQHDFKIGSVTRADGCTTVQLQHVVMTDADRQIQFCADEEAWPFANGDTVRLESPMFFVASSDGLRLQRADDKAFELLRIKRPAANFDTTAFTFVENVSCAQVLDPLANCRAVSLGTAVTPNASIALTGARAWIASATTPVFTIGCQPMRDPWLEVVARSDP